MNIVDDAKTILLKAWSVRLALLGAAFSAAEVALPYFDAFIPEHTMAILAVIASAGAAIARVIQQKAISGAKDGTENTQ